MTISRYCFILLFYALTIFVFSEPFVFSQEPEPSEDVSEKAQPEQSADESQPTAQEEMQPVQSAEEDFTSENSVPFEFVGGNSRRKWKEYSNYLFDSKTFMGWTTQQTGPYGGGRFTIEDGAICSDPKYPGLIYTTGQFSDFTLEFEMSTDGPTDAFLLLRTSPNPKNLSTSCYAVVLASTQEGQGRTPGTILGHHAAPYSLRDESKEDKDGRRWRRFSIFANRKHIRVTHGTNANETYSEEAVRRGHIAFLVTRGKVRFRNIIWGVTNTQSLYNLVGSELRTWPKLESVPGFSTKITFGNLHISGGPGVVESEEIFDNFVIYTEFKMQNPDSKVGLFFRCVPQKPRSGYECIFYNNSFSKNRNLFEHYFTGSLFGLQRARNLGAADEDWNSLTVNAVDNHFQLWVNGIQSVDWTDRRPVSDSENPDPKEGLRLQPGPIQLQGHDAGTNLNFRAFAAGPVTKRWISNEEELQEREEHTRRVFMRPELIEQDE